MHSTTNPIGETTQANTATGTKSGVTLDLDVSASAFIVSVSGINTHLDTEA